MTTKRDFYDVLGVDRSADEKAIKKAFRQKAKALHPDTNPSPTAESEFKELGEAYSILSDAEKRQVYDTYGHAGLNSGMGGGGGGGYAHGWDFMSEFTDLGDIFSAFFGGAGGRRGGAMRGDDLRVGLQLTFMEAAFGCAKSVSVEQLRTCSTCQGSGAKAGSQPITCTTCQGHGQIRQSTQTLFGHFTQIVTCPQCQGSGQLIPDPCGDCHGQGKRRETKSLDVTIPAGVDSGTRLRISEEGDAGSQHAPAGDLYIVLQVQPDEHFERDGYDVLSRVPVSYAQLCLGDEVTIPLLQGTQKIKIAAGTQNGHVQLLRNEGIPILNQPNRRGDLHLLLDVQIPTKLSGRERELLEELHQLHQQRLTPSTDEKEGAGGFFASLRQRLLGHD
jgi:molecular chaperone DnaJ